MSEQGKEIVEKLDRASFGSPSAIADFFEALLESEVFVPLRKHGEGKEQLPGPLPQAAQEQGGALEFLTVQSEGNWVLPIFSHEGFAEVWAQHEISTERRRFKTLIWEIGQKTWLYINPGQEVGKEISPWEIERLKEGREAIPEIVAELSETDPGLEVHCGRDLFPELKKVLLPILEVYTEVEEAFLISVSAAEIEGDTPMLGLRHSGIPPEKLSRLREELRSLVEQEVIDRKDILLVDDLNRNGDPNAALFQGATPFFIRQRTLPHKRSPIGGLFSRFFGERAS